MLSPSEDEPSAASPVDVSGTVMCWAVEQAIPTSVPSYLIVPSWNKSDLYAFKLEFLGPFLFGQQTLCEKVSHWLGSGTG